MNTRVITSIQMYILIVVLFVRWQSRWFGRPDARSNSRRIALVEACCAAGAKFSIFSTYVGM